MASADRIDDTTAAIIRSSSRDRCSRTIPGVSNSTIWWSGALARPTTRCRVVCGRGLTAHSFCPTSALMSVDLPALGLPITATYPDRWPGGSAPRSSSVRAGW